eukprot:TRINITY_DN3725_c0_g2_i1.p1 TRINITY_DN3725_c0_g2~~TRINITY_DN3725_c0_g2_i1.p1  ORF type:complete len:662 (+),score=171.54 TRINITY_DN3725_c0_g2_i1:44-2029(+)
MSIRVFLDAPKKDGGNGSASSSTPRVVPIASFAAPASYERVLHSLHLEKGGALRQVGAVSSVAATSTIPDGDYVLDIPVSQISLKVVLHETKLVIPVPSHLHKIHHLMDVICRRMTPYYVAKKEKSSSNADEEEDELDGNGDESSSSNLVRLAQLRTMDGFALHPYDTIGSVLRDGDTVLAVEWNAWVKEQEKLCYDVWLKVDQPDFIDSKNKRIRIGRHQHNKLFIAIDVDRECVLLEMFDVEALHNFSKSGIQMVMHKEGSRQSGKFTWSAKVHFVINDKGRVTDVELSVKSYSDDRAEIKSIGIGMKKGDLVAGPFRTVQSSDIELENAAQNAYVLPSEHHTGPGLSIPPPIPSPVPLAKLVPSSSSSDVWAKIRGEEVDPMLADQSWARDGSFNNLFYAHLNFINPTEQEVPVIKMTGEYNAAEEGKAPQWTPLKHAVIGRRSGYYNYSWNWDNNEFEIPANKTMQIAVNLGISIKAPQFDRHRRAHGSLPSPLHFRVVFEDIKGNTGSMELTYFNPPYDLPSKEKRIERVGHPLAFFLECDDTVGEDKVLVDISVVEENGFSRLEIYNSENSSSTHYLYKDALDKLKFEAHKTGVSEVRLSDDMCTDKNGRQVTLTGMVDVTRPSGPLYALKVAIKTLSSYAEGFYLVPRLKNSNQ